MGNIPDPADVESWNQETGAWDGFSDKRRWVAWMGIYEGRDREEVLSKVRKVLDGTDLSKVCVFVRPHPVFEQDGICSSSIGLVRFRKDPPDSLFKTVPFESAVFSDWDGVTSSEARA